MKKIYLVTVIILLIYLTIDFITYAKESFFQLNYKWSEIKQEYKYHNIIIDSLSNSYLRIGKTNTFNKEPDINNTFCITLNNKKYYYRSSNFYIDGNKRLLTGGFWLNKMPKKPFNNASLSEVKLELNQSGNKKVCMIGDSQLIWNDAKHMRKRLKQGNQDLVFVGNLRDLYAYPVSASNSYKYKDIVRLADSFPLSDIYVLFLGAHDNSTKIEDIKTQLKTTLIKLKSKKKGCKILLITLPKSSIKTRNEHNKIINSIIRSFKSDNQVTIVDLYNELEKTNALDYLNEDKIHMNQLGYEILNSMLEGALK